MGGRACQAYNVLRLKSESRHKRVYAGCTWEIKILGYVFLWWGCGGGSIYLRLPPLLMGHLVRLLTPLPILIPIHTVLLSLVQLLQVVRRASGQSLSTGSYALLSTSP